MRDMLSERAMGLAVCKKLMAPTRKYVVGALLFQ